MKTYIAKNLKQNYCMKLYLRLNGYDYYIADDPFFGKSKIYNVQPINEPAPKGGYYDSDFICRIKKVPNIFKLHLDDSYTVEKFKTK